MNLEQYYNITEKVIRELGVSPEDTRGEKEGQWNLQYGEYPIWIDVYLKDDTVFFQVVSPMLKIENHPSRNKIIETAMEINDALILASISLYQETLWMRSILPDKFITEENILTILRTVGNAALKYGEYLKSDF